MDNGAALISRFYGAFGERDAEGMVACYHPEVAFRDPVFLDLNAERAKAMWRMLCERGKDLRVEASGIEADGERGRAHWDARYTFAVTGRKVLNRIDATFRFRDGLIVEHHDSFDLWRWASMALGPSGTLLGWLPPVKNTIRRQAARALDEYMAQKR